MPVLKCKMCGGDLHVVEGQTVCECEYCGTKQTLPKVDNERKLNLYDRANHFRRANDFDKAMNVYEQILNEDRTDAEAYWSLVLCRYGIEYVEDPATHKRIPTVNRAQYTSIFADEDYKQALEYATPEQKVVYQEEARVIDTIQKGILEISQKEEPFDVFICYKETDNNGRRTQDSVLANDLYHQLTNEGFKVFFSRITLEDKLGTAYEPYIFAALNSAKVMVVLGTRPEYFNAVWVKNEWSRYLSLIRKGEKKVLIPAYRDMDPYDLPEEFSHLQAQDMSKLGFMQDLIRGIKKLTETDKKVKEKETVVINQSNQNIGPLLKRISIFLEDGDYASADEYCDRVLDMDPENGDAYLGKLLAEKRKPNLNSLLEYYRNLFITDGYERKEISESGEDHVDEIVQKYTIDGYLEASRIRKNYAYELSYLSNVQNRINQKKQIEEELNSSAVHRLLKYSSPTIAEQFNAIRDEYNNRVEQAKKEDADNKAEAIADYKQFLAETDESVRKQYEAACKERENDYQSYIRQFRECKVIDDYNTVIRKLRSLTGYSESNSYIQKCEDGIRSIKEKEKAEADRIAEEKRAAEEAARKKRNKTIMIVAVIVIFAFVYATVIAPRQKYNKAVSLYESGSYAEAYALFSSLGDYNDSSSYASNAYSKMSSVEQLRVTLPEIEIGKTITFGNYEQDKSTLNGKESIEWEVLDMQDNKILVISKYALDCREYNSIGTAATWEGSTLRTWLNGTFYNSTFSDDEKQLIATTMVSADKNPGYSTAQGKATNDKVFLLSITEVNKYFDSDNARATQGTQYAYAQGAYREKNGKCWWWLRTSGSDSSHAARVNSVGEVSSYGVLVTTDGNAVRPALWLNLEP